MQRKVQIAGGTFFVSKYMFSEEMDEAQTTRRLEYRTATDEYTRASARNQGAYFHRRAKMSISARGQCFPSGRNAFVPCLSPPLVELQRSSRVLRAGSCQRRP